MKLTFIKVVGEDLNFQVLTGPHLVMDLRILV